MISEAKGNSPSGRAVVYEPELLLLDEPLSNLVAKLWVQMRVEIRELVKALDITSLYVTHDQEEALVLSDRIAVMDKGMILQVGGPREVYKAPSDSFSQVSWVRRTCYKSV